MVCVSGRRDVVAVKESDSDEGGDDCIHCLHLHLHYLFEPIENCQSYILELSYLLQNQETQSLVSAHDLDWCTSTALLEL
jgi:hypothetical protein